MAKSVKSKPGKIAKSSDAAHGFAVAAAGAAVLATTFTVYVQVRTHKFLGFDDLRFIVENHHVATGLTWENFVWAFTSSEFENWHPLTWLSHIIIVALFGLNPGAHVMMNVTIHLLGTVAAYVALRSLTGAPWRSLFVAALFALHPLHVESVAWISERKDVLSGLFWFLALWSYGWYARRPSAARYGAVALCLLLGLMSKPMAVTLPCVLLLLDYWPLKRMGDNERPFVIVRARALRLCAEKAPLFVLIAVISAITYSAQSEASAMVEMSLFPLGFRIANALTSYVAYIAMTVWPGGLAPFYPHPGEAISMAYAAVCATVLFAISGVVLWKVRAAPYAFVGWFWFVGTLVPVIGIIQVGSQAMADRYTYIPLTGLFIVVAWGAEALLRKRTELTKITGIAALSVLAVFAVLTWIQVGYWRTDLSLFNRALEVTENNDLAHNSVGVALNDLGDPEAAIAHFERALEINPARYRTHVNLGNALFAQGHTGPAVKHYRTALRQRPNHVPAHLNLAVALFKSGRHAEAMTHYQEGLRLDPYNVQLHNNVGIAFAVQGLMDEAASHFREALRLRPGYERARVNLERAEAELGRR